MPFDQQNVDTRQQRMIEGRRRWNENNTGQMSNTKWREVFRCLAQRPELRFEIGWTDPEVMSSYLNRPVDDSQIETTGLRDPGLGGGPFEYWEIFWMRFPRKFVNPTATGRERLEVQDLSSFAYVLGQLGMLPIVFNDEYLEIMAYAHSAMSPNT